MRILIVQLNPTVGALRENADKIIAALEEGHAQGCDLVVFSELVLCGYPPEDLLLLHSFTTAAEKELERIVQASKGISAIVGTIRPNLALREKELFNSAAIISNGELLGFQDKSLLPTYDVFDERRFFEPGLHTGVWNLCGKRVAVTICEDMWQHAELLTFSDYRRDPVAELSTLHPELLINLSASPYSFDKTQTRFAVCASAALTLECPMILCNQVGGNDSLIFDGHSLVLDSQARLIAQAKGFEEDRLIVDTEKLLPMKLRQPNPIDDLYHALVLGLRDYFFKQGFTKACFGLSGGIDSALVACLAAEALGPKNVLAVCMPSRYSSPESLSDSRAVAYNLGIECMEIPIEKPFQAYLEQLTPFFNNKPADTTEENIQARIRGMILMALSNKHGYIVLSTGNKSELAMGYCTLYGDMCGGLGVISDVTKAQVYALCEHLNQKSPRIPSSILTKPPSAELRPNQKDSDTLPDYSIVDNVLKGYVERHQSPEEIALHCKYPLELVKALVHKIHRNEYKRYQAPPGLRVTEKSFTAGRRFPIVQKWM